MFTIEFLSILKNELKNSLYNEAMDSLDELPPSVKNKARIVLLYYQNFSCLAGLEFWNNSFAEWKYFSMLKSDFLIKKNGKKFKKFLSTAIRNLKRDFGVEDFRFIQLERSEEDRVKISRLLDSYISEIINSLTKINENLDLKKSGIYNYKKSLEDPRKKGVEIEIKKIRTPKWKLEQFRLAENCLARVWEKGFILYKTLTDKVLAVCSPGLVSYSHFTEQGISYINLIDRELFETVDDLVHENSHHHMNILLKKYRIFKKDFKEEVFYSPWRNSLRSIYGILHASFTFSFGSFLFYNMILNEDATVSFLGKSSLDRARFRFCEEVYQVRYSLDDLKWGIKNKIFTSKGAGMIGYLDRENIRLLEFAKNQEKKINNKKYISSLKNLKNILSESRAEYKLK